MRTYGDDDVGLQRREKAAGPSRRQAWKAMAVFAVAALLLNAEAIREGIARKPYGPARRVGLVLAGPPAAVARATGLNRVRRFLESIRDRLAP